MTAGITSPESIQPNYEVVKTPFGLTINEALDDPGDYYVAAKPSTDSLKILNEVKRKLSPFAVGKEKASEDLHLTLLYIGPLQPMVEAVKQRAEWNYARNKQLADFFERGLNGILAGGFRMEVIPSTERYGEGRSIAISLGSPDFEVQMQQLSARFLNLIKILGIEHEWLENNPQFQYLGKFNPHVTLVKVPEPLGKEEYRKVMGILAAYDGTEVMFDAPQWFVNKQPL